MAVPVSTLCDVFREVVTLRPRPDAFREKRDGTWSTISTGQFAEDVAGIAEGLTGLGMEKGDRVAILSDNRYHWTATDFAILARGGVVVPIYPTLPSDQVGAILADAGAKWVFVSNAEQLAKVLSLGELLKEIDTIISFDPVTARNRAVLSWDELREKGMETFAPRGLDPVDVAVPGQFDDLATIIYTSGTTGRPKGVMLSHGNLVSNCVTSVRTLNVGPSDRYLSFLPLSHVFERMGMYTMFLSGASIAFADSIETVAADAVDVRPTILLGVPRFFEKFYDRVMAAIQEASPLRRKMFRWAAAVGARAFRAREVGDSPTGMLKLEADLAERLVFRKLRQRIGGCVRFFVSGSAPLRPDIIRFFHSVGIPIYEGYGLTETSPVVSVNRPDRWRVGSVGQVYDGVSVRLAEDGEILVQGPNVTMGYFRNPEATREVLTEDGWLKTGDVGRLDEEGFLYITDRKKDLIITAGGKNVAPQPIENRLRANPLVADACLVGNRLKFISALILPDFEALRSEVESKGVVCDDPRRMVEDPTVRRLFDEAIAAVNEGLASFETIKKYVLLTDELTIDNGALTPTMKLKRRVVEERFADDINALYD